MEQIKKFPSEILTRNIDHIAIKELRGKIDRIDRKIIRLLEKRVEVAGRIGKIKKRNGLKISDIGREKEIIKNVSNSGIDKNFVKKLFGLIIEYCKDEEKD